MSEKKKFKMLSSFAILFLIIFVMAVGTWFIPAGKYDVDKDGNYIAGTYKEIERSPQGFWEVFMAPISGELGTDSTPGAIEVSFFVMVFGGFLGIVTKTQAIDVGISSLITRSKGREKRLIVVLMTLFALGGTSYGMSEETVAFYPLLIPMMLAAGFDTMTATAIILLGAGVGCLGSTINPFATGVASQSAGISLGDGLFWRVLILVISTAICILYVYRYASRVEKDPSTSVVYDSWDEHKTYFLGGEKKSGPTPELTSKQRTILWLFGITFAVMVCSLIPWTSISPKLTLFENLTKGIHSIPVLGDIVGRGMIALGEWYFREITMLFLIMGIVIGKIAGMDEADIGDTFVNGAKDMVGVALVIGLARGIQVIMNDGHITATVLHWGEVGLAGLPKPVFALLSFLFYIPMTFLIPSTSGLAAATMPVMAPLSTMCGVNPHVMVTIYQTAAGIVNLATPTYAVVMAALSISRIPYDRWLVFVTKLLVILTVVNGAIMAFMAVVA